MNSGVTADDYQALLAAVGDLHAQRTMAGLQRAAIRAVAALVPALHVTYNELDAHGGRATARYDDPTTERAAEAVMPAFARLMGGHPVLRRMDADVAAGRTTPATRISDCVSPAAFLASPLYDECLRHLSTRHQLILPIRAAGLAVGIALSRDRHDFSARDCRLLELLRPHLAAAYEAARRRAQVATLFDPDDEPAGAAALGALGLTPRQARVLFWAFHGKSTPEIAIILGARPRTVHKHFEHLYARLGVGSRTSAIHVALARLLGEGEARGDPAAERRPPTPGRGRASAAVKKDS